MAKSTDPDKNILMNAGPVDNHNQDEEFAEYFTLTDDKQTVGVSVQWPAYVTHVVSQGQYLGMVVPEVQEDAWSVKDYIE